MKVNFFFPRLRASMHYAPLCTSGRTTPKYLAPALLTVYGNKGRIRLVQEIATWVELG